MTLNFKQVRSCLEVKTCL